MDFEVHVQLEYIVLLLLELERAISRNRKSFIQKKKGIL
jgi:hypothetical protein